MRRWTKIRYGTPPLGALLAVTVLLGCQIETGLSDICHDVSCHDLLCDKQILIPEDEVQELFDCYGGTYDEDGTPGPWGADAPEELQESCAVGEECTILVGSGIAQAMNDVCGCEYSMVGGAEPPGECCEYPAQAEQTFDWLLAGADLMDQIAQDCGVGAIVDFDSPRDCVVGEEETTAFWSEATCECPVKDE